ncbi:hypothetical protein [Rhizobium leguminosarum]|uniref:hypothetical protein n=1 Tax=Rhizobium leguminosarum TaxID=384 RepID=UPI003ECD638D
MTVFRSLGMLTYLLAAAPVFAECDQAAVDPMIQNIQNLLEQERETLFQLSNCPDSGCSRSVIERWGGRISREGNLITDSPYPKRALANLSEAITGIKAYLDKCSKPDLTPAVKPPAPQPL